MYTRRGLFALLNASTIAVLAVGVTISDGTVPLWVTIAAAAAMFVLGGIGSGVATILVSGAKPTNNQVNVLIAVTGVLVVAGCLAGALVPLESFDRGPTLETTRSFAVSMFGGLGWILAFVFGPLIAEESRNWERSRPCHFQQPC